MPSTEKLDTHHKALTLNLDAIRLRFVRRNRAGQEVARWFLVVGGASGTGGPKLFPLTTRSQRRPLRLRIALRIRQRLEAMLTTNGASF